MMYHIFRWYYLLYSGTPPYGHGHPTATLLIWSPRYDNHFILAKKELSQLFLFKEPFKYGNLVNKARLLWPAVDDRVNGIGR